MSYRYSAVSDDLGYPTSDTTLLFGRLVAKGHRLFNDVHSDKHLIHLQILGMQPKYMPRRVRFRYGLTKWGV